MKQFEDDMEENKKVGICGTIVWKALPKMRAIFLPVSEPLACVQDCAGKPLGPTNGRSFANCRIACRALYAGL
jgi:hypothetical protein